MAPLAPMSVVEVEGVGKGALDETGPWCGTRSRCAATPSSRCSRSYVTQLLMKQKALRVEQVLLILKVIGVDPAEFFAYQPPRWLLSR